MARLAELAVVVPLELSARLVDAVPVVADKVPAAADRVRREVVLARFIGKLAVDQGLRELRARLEPTEPVEPAAAATTATATVSTGGASEIGSPEIDVEEHDVPKIDVEELALADYDHLSSSQIVAKLADLDPDDLAQVAAYERANRHRRTVLGKLDQLGVS